MVVRGTRWYLQRSSADAGSTLEPLGSSSPGVGKCIQKPPPDSVLTWWADRLISPPLFPPFALRLRQPYPWLLRVTDDIPADVFIKALDRIKLNKFVRHVGLSNLRGYVILFQFQVCSPHGMFILPLFITRALVATTVRCYPFLDSTRCRFNL